MVCLDNTLVFFLFATKITLLSCIYLCVLRPCPLWVLKNMDKANKANVVIFSISYMVRIHRRRIEFKDKAKVFASDWRTESLPR